VSKAASCEASQPTEVEFSELNAIVKRAKALGLSDEDCDMLSRIIETLAKLTLELEVKGTTIRRLRQLIFGSGSEKIKVVLKGKSDGDDEDKSGDDKDKSSDDEDKSGDVKDKSSDDEGEQQQGESDDADQGAQGRTRRRRTRDTVATAPKPSGVESPSPCPSRDSTTRIHTRLHQGHGLQARATPPHSNRGGGAADGNGLRARKLPLRSVWTALHGGASAGRR
jgi:hypothetical protein